MNEENRKKREWVKSAAIVFLSVMLLLTFFSQTIMNYSLPQVATQRIQSGTITAKIRGTGTVESGELYNVEVTQVRKIASIATRVGDEVEIGDIILYLEDKESEELKTAQDTLEALELSFSKLLLTSDIDAGILNNIQNGRITSLAEYQNKILAAKSAIATAQKDVDYWTERATAFENQIKISSNVTVNTLEEQKALNEATTNLANAKLALENAEIYIRQVSGGDAATVAAADAELVRAEKAVDEWTKRVNSCQVALNTAQIKVSNANAESTSTVANLNAQLAVINTNLSAAKATLAEKESVYSGLVGNVNTEYDLNDKVQQIQNQKELIAELHADSVGSTVKASIAGTITAINVIAGGSTSPSIPVATIQPAGKGYTVSLSVTNEQADRINVGDPAELVNSWWYSNIKATVAGKKPDTTDPTKKKLVILNLTGDLTAGQYLSFSIGQKSASYDKIVPNSAIREDNNGKFILIIQQKSSPLGNRYVATRVDIEVLASDDTQSAVSGALIGYEDVITTSTKPLETGQLVRLPD